MTYRDQHDESLERIMHQLTESALSLSDEAIIAEVSDSGADPEGEAKLARTALRDALQKLENVNRHLSSLGHTINPNSWHCGWSGYRNTCVTCGSFVSFKIKTGEMTGDALYAPCPERDQYTNRTREASRG